MQELRKQVENELRSDILPFWLKYTIDDEYGGFRGQITNDLVIDPHAQKGLILNARILWTFAKAYSVYREDIYLKTARRAYDYLTRYFWDVEFGGVYWMLDYHGKPVETLKRIYGQAFALYAFAEYHAATGDKDALAKAIQMHQAIEKHSYDAAHGGYFETYERDWKLSANQALSDADMDEKKSMNTHLHVMEAYATLLRSWNDPHLHLRLRELVEVFLNRIIDPKAHHFLMFFDEKWTPKSDHKSFGHDIEGSWLLVEAAEALGDHSLLAKVRSEAVCMAQAVYDEALDPDGGLMYEADSKRIIETEKHWWPQAEAVVGFFNAWQISGDERFLKAAEHSWQFIDKYIVDHKRGEWYWFVTRDGKPSDTKYKVDPWKCPYHNSRMCLEIMSRVDSLKK